MPRFNARNFTDFRGNSLLVRQRTIHLRNLAKIPGKTSLENRQNALWHVNYAHTFLRRVSQKNQIKQEMLRNSNEKPTVPTQGQNYSKINQHTKIFPTIPIM
jgi:hypothetical protein